MVYLGIWYSEMVYLDIWYTEIFGIPKRYTLHCFETVVVTSTFGCWYTLNSLSMIFITVFYVILSLFDWQILSESKTTFKIRNVVICMTSFNSNDNPWRHTNFKFYKKNVLKCYALLSKRSKTANTKDSELLYVYITLSMTERVDLYWRPMKISRYTIIAISKSKVYHLGIPKTWVYQISRYTI